MTIDFNKEILIPDNFMLFDNTIINLRVIPGELSDSTKMNFTWNVIGMTSKRISI